MNLTMTALKEGDNCCIFADMFPIDEQRGFEYGMSAKPAAFIRRALFTQDVGEYGPLLTLPLADAKKMAQEILKL